MMPSAAAVAERYGDLLDGYVMDTGDAEAATHFAPKVTLAPTLMTNLAEREQLARVVLEAADALASSKRRPGPRRVSGDLGGRARQGIDGAKHRLSSRLEPGGTSRCSR